MSIKIEIIISLFKMKIYEDFKLLNYNTFGVESTSKYYIEISSEEAQKCIKLNHFKKNLF